MAYEPSQWAGVGPGASNFKKLTESIKRKVEWYLHETEEVRSALEQGWVNVEERKPYLASKVEIISMNIACDLSVTMQVQIDNVNIALYEKQVKDFHGFLRELRSTLQLMMSCESM